MCDLARARTLEDDPDCAASARHMLHCTLDGLKGVALAAVQARAGARGAHVRDGPVDLKAIERMILERGSAPPPATIIQQCKQASEMVALLAKRAEAVRFFTEIFFIFFGEEGGMFCRRGNFGNFSFIL